MFDVVFQRISRDEMYRLIVGTLVDSQYLPVYHVRTANETTYWGATMNRDLVTNTAYDRSPRQEDLETLYEEADKYNYRTPQEMLVGDNRLGHIMVEALNAYRQLRLENGMGTTRVHGLVHQDLRLELTPLGEHVMPQAQRELMVEGETTLLKEENKAAAVGSTISNDEEEDAEEEETHDDVVSKSNSKRKRSRKRDKRKNAEAEGERKTLLKKTAVVADSSETRVENHEEDDILEEIWRHVERANNQLNERQVQAILDEFDLSDGPSSKNDAKVYQLF
jgi:hypothetical protein